MRKRKMFVAVEELLLPIPKTFPLEMLDVFRLCVVAEMSVAPASSNPQVPDKVNIQHSPRRTKHARPSAEDMCHDRL